MPRTGARDDPFAAFRFQLEIDAIPVAGFTGCSGLDVEIEVETFEEGGENRFVHKLPGRRRYGDVELKRGIVGRELWDWLHGQRLGNFDHGKSVTIVIGSLNTEHDPLKFVLKNALVTRWRGPELAADTSAVTMETVTLAHQGLTWET
jgi:phage tail-like protein